MLSTVGIRKDSQGAKVWIGLSRNEKKSRIFVRAFHIHGAEE